MRHEDSLHGFGTSLISGQREVAGAYRPGERNAGGAPQAVFYAVHGLRPSDGNGPFCPGGPDDGHGVSRVVLLSIVLDKGATEPLSAQGRRSRQSITDREVPVKSTIG